MNLSKEETQTFEDFNAISYSNRKNLSKLSSQIETKKEMILFMKLQEAYQKLEQAGFYLDQLEKECGKLEQMFKNKLKR
nr:MAG TPA: hypothetical protein [Caudoviricetes sp.]